VIPNDAWKPRGNEEPISRILLMLTATVGLPYTLLASTSPLLQAVYARRYGGEPPYAWFALSNLASMLALLTYPIVVEPWLAVRTQALLWSGLYVAWATAAAAAVWSSAPGMAAAAAPAEHIPVSTQLWWLLLPACASSLLLAGTGYLSENVAPVPLLWIVPLSAYLLSFILCFARGDWYRPGLFLRLDIAALLSLAWLIDVQSLRFEVPIAASIVTGGVFLVSMFCHGEVVRRRPGPALLTRFYLLIAAGGALGGVLVGAIAPVALPVPIEFSLAIVICATAAVALELPYARLLTRAALLGALAATIVIAIRQASSYAAGNLAVARNFYGTLRVAPEFVGFPAAKARTLEHGVIKHGSQLIEDGMQLRPTAYFAIGSGVQLAIEATHRPGQRVGIVGLGTGTIAAYGRAGDVYRFYELNPLVLDFARKYFSFLADSPARVEVVLGDARLSLERETPQGYDVLAVDAFSSDSIPVHLLTREALQLYLRHLRQDGILALHISNKVLDLEPVIAAGAAAADLDGLRVTTTDEPRLYRLGADWILLARNPAVLQRAITGGAGRRLRVRPDLRLWTDDYSNIWQVIK
jgi:SAM-dependent methyltransferase